MTQTEIGSLGKETLDELVLFRSELKPTGAVYTRLGTFKLE
jgi:2'-5' RNA ligase